VEQRDDRHVAVRLHGVEQAEIDAGEGVTQPGVLTLDDRGVVGVERAAELVDERAGGDAADVETVIHR
jgi:hypothetical protein